MKEQITCLEFWGIAWKIKDLWRTWALYKCHVLICSGVQQGEGEQVLPQDEVRLNKVGGAKIKMIHDLSLDLSENFLDENPAYKIIKSGYSSLSKKKLHKYSAPRFRRWLRQGLDVSHVHLRAHGNTLSKPTY